MRSTISATAFAWQLILATTYLCRCCIAQEPPTAETTAEIERELVRAEGLVRQSELEGARAAAQAAWHVASQVEHKGDPALQSQLWRLGLTAYAAQDLQTAHDAWLAVTVHREATLAKDHLDLQRARGNLAIAKKGLGDLQGALQLEERLLAALLLALPDDHLDLQAARGNLGLTKKALGDLRGAIDLFEKVHEVTSRTLPDEHPRLQTARQNLAIAKLHIGDSAGALELQQKVVSILPKLLPEDDLHLQSARSDLAAMLSVHGDLVGALALQERVYEARTRLLPDHHPELRTIWMNLAATKQVLGDVRGALALRQRVLHSCVESLPADHPDLHAARLGLAGVLSAVGDMQGARALEEQAVADMEATLPDDHPILQAAHLNLASTRLALGDLEGALGLQERGLQALMTRLPDDHLDVQTARSALALAKWRSGALAEAHALSESVLAVYSRVLPADHPKRTSAQAEVAWLRLLRGDHGAAVSLVKEWSAVTRSYAPLWTLAPRMAGLRAEDERPLIDLLLTMATGFGNAAARDDLMLDALLASQTLRGIETRVARRMRRALLADADRTLALQQQLIRVVADLAGIAATEAPDESDVGAGHNASLASAVLRKERLQRELAELAARSGDVDTGQLAIDDLVARLPSRSVAVAVVRYERHRPAPEHPGRTFSESCLAGLILHRGGINLRQLGPYAPIEDLVAALRTQAGAGDDRGRQASSGVDALATHKALCKAVWDPLLAAAGDADTIYLVVDEPLELVPLDALSTADGTLVGSKVALRPLLSLLDLCEPTGNDIGARPNLLAIGDLDYDEPARKPLAVLGAAAAPPPTGQRDGAPRSFRPLLESKTEIGGIAHFFAKTFPEGNAQTLVRNGASKSTLMELAPKATFLHLATHGYFAPESIASQADRKHDDTPRALRQDQRITGLSPLVLCGLALSGANLPPDQLGRTAGIITAEEILSLDLSHCYLATLSACDTSLGVRRAGQGYASLRAALLGAGARYVLTSLWKVGDEATMQLMSDFYRRLWVLKQEPHRALWDAKMEARKKGAPFRDWAGWVLTGR